MVLGPLLGLLREKRALNGSGPLFYLKPRGHGPGKGGLWILSEANLGNSQRVESLEREIRRGLDRSNYGHPLLVVFQKTTQHDTKADVHLEKNFNAISFCDF